MRTVVLCALILVGCNCASVITQRDDEALINSLRARTLQIRVTCETSRSSGTGVVLGPLAIGHTAIATASHVAAPGCDYRFGSEPLKLVARDEVHDIAILQLAQPYYGATLQPAERYLGQPAIAVGYPAARLDRVTRLQVTRGFLISDYGSLLKMSTAFWFGSSGGPIFTEDGKLIGLSIAVLAFGGTVPMDDYFAVPAEYVFMLLQSVY